MGELNRKSERENVLKGGEFLVKESTAQQCQTPEDLNEEQLMFANMVQDFLAQEILPEVDALDKMKEGLMVSKMELAGQLGLLSAAIPEEFGGMAVDFISESVLVETMGPSFSFGVAFAAHTGIGTLPILYYGNQAQKEKYLPKIGSGEWKAAYCLTEPNAGSDALNAKTTATLSEDGKHYVLNGQKMWITNGGFADLFTVFAKIDGKEFTGFLVEADSEGLTRGEEEDKLGIKGSSTCQIFFENVKVPVENLLGEIGKGHKIAFNVLNIGRYKLGAMCSGGVQKMTGIACSYAKEREQFGKAIAEFGAIRHKLAQMNTQTFALESMTHRIAGLIHQDIEMRKAGGTEAIQAKLEAAEEYSIECALLKVFGSEVLDFVVDEAVQIFGGMGFSEESVVSRVYRDARINRIFEGTNEINRLLAVGMLLKKGLKGEIDLMGPAMEVQKDLMSIPSIGMAMQEGLEEEKKCISNLKKAALMVSGAAVQKYMNKLEDEQELMMMAADLLLDIYVIESMVLRAEKMQLADSEKSELAEEMCRFYLNERLPHFRANCNNAIAAIAEGDEARLMTMGVKRFTKYQAFNPIAASKKIGQATILAGGYTRKS